MRVLHVIGEMNYGGAESMIMNLYRNIDRDNVQFDFVENTYKKSSYDEEIKKLGGKIYNCPHFNGKNYFTYKKWWIDFLEEHKDEYTIIHGHIGSCSNIYLSIAKKYGLFTIAHSHSSGTDYSLKSLLYKIASFRTRYIADYFFACSKAAGIDRYGKKVVNSKKYHMLNNAIDTDTFSYNMEARKKIRDEFGINDEDLLIGHVGRFIKAKNHTYLMEVAKEVIGQRPNTKVILVGEGELREEVEEKAEEIGILENCIFTGIRTDVSEIMQAMDVLVFPSLYEGLPVTLVEAQSTGLPCVISNKVPIDSIIIKDLVTICRLQDSTMDWAKCILKIDVKERKSRKQEIADAMFSIVEVSKWLEEFYESKNIE